MKSRRTNREIIDAFAEALTEGARRELSPETLAATKAWRRELWRRLREVERRMCPEPGRDEILEKD